MTSAPPDGTIASPQPATHLWCPLCRTVHPIRAELMPAGSRATMGGRFDGDHLRCSGCGTVVATVLVQTTEAS